MTADDDAVVRVFFQLWSQCINSQRSHFIPPWIQAFNKIQIELEEKRLRGQKSAMDMYIICLMSYIWGNFIGNPWLGPYLGY